MVGECVYVDTSIVIRTLNSKEPGRREAQRILGECCRRCRCVWSTIHGYEGFRSDITRHFFYGYLASLGAEYAEMDADYVFERAEEYRSARGLSPKKLVDIAHMVAARILGCRLLLARDRFIWHHANNFGLTYVNWDTHRGRCPCPVTVRPGSLAFRSGGRGETRQASSSTSSSKPPEAHPAGRHGRSSGTGRKRRSPSKRQRRGSRSSRRRPRGAGPSAGQLAHADRQAVR